VKFLRSGWLNSKKKRESKKAASGKLQANSTHNLYLDVFFIELPCAVRCTLLAFRSSQATTGKQVLSMLIHYCH
jgi:hypothetical protein